MKIRFQEVSLYGEKSGKCVVCGKRTKRSKKVTHTVNPFNKNEDGTIRTYDEVMERVSEEVKKWKQEPIYHVKCEG